MSSLGFIQVHAYASFAQLPLKDTAVTVTDINGSAIAFRLTDRNGQLEKPIEIPVPELSASQSPNTGIIPYSVVNLYAKHPKYQQITVEKLQVFPNMITIQNLELIPLPELPALWNQSEVFETEPQNL